MLSEHNRKPIYRASLVFKDVLLWAFVVTAILATSALAQEIPEPPQFETPVIFQDNFEENADAEPPAPRIEFVTDTILFFESPGETLPLAVRVYDENGDLDPTPNLTWSSEDQLLTGLTVNGPFTAEAAAQQIWPGIVELVVEDNETGARASASAYFVERAESVGRQFESEASSSRGSAIPTIAHPDAIYIKSEYVIGWSGRDRLQEHTLHLRRNAKTEAISVGNFLYSGNKAGVLVEVLQVVIAADEVRLSAIPAALNAVFQSAVFEDSVATSGAAVAAASAVRAGRPGSKRSALDRIRMTPSAKSGGSLNCEGEGSTDITLIDAGFDPSLVFRSLIVIRNWNIDLVEFGVDASLGATLDVGLSLGAEVNVTCKIRPLGLPRLSFGPAISIKPALAPQIDLTGEASLQVQDTSWELNNLAPTWSFNGGLRNEGDGWRAFRTGEPPSATPQPESPDISSVGALELNGMFNLILNTKFCLGWCLGFSTLGELNLFKAGIGADYALRFEAPLDKRLHSYSGPQVNSDINGSAGLDIALKKKGWVRYLPVSTGFEAKVDLFDKRWPLLETPTLELDVICSPDDCQFEPGEEGEISLILKAVDSMDNDQFSESTTGQAEFYLQQNDEESLVLVDEATFENGTAQTTIMISSFAAGDYKVYPRLSINELTYWFWTDNFPLGVDKRFSPPEFSITGSQPPPSTGTYSYYTSCAATYAITVSPFDQVPGSQPSNISEFTHHATYFPFFMGEHLYFVDISAPGGDLLKPIENHDGNFHDSSDFVPVKHNLVGDDPALRIVGVHSYRNDEFLLTVKVEDGNYNDNDLFRIYGFDVNGNLTYSVDTPESKGIIFGSAFDDNYAVGTVRYIFSDYVDAEVLSHDFRITEELALINVRTGDLNPLFLVKERQFDSSENTNTYSTDILLNDIISVNQINVLSSRSITPSGDYIFAGWWDDLIILVDKVSLEASVISQNSCGSRKLRRIDLFRD